MKNTAESLSLNLNLWIIATICTSIHCDLREIDSFLTGIKFAHLVGNMMVQIGSQQIEGRHLVTLSTYEFAQPLPKRQAQPRCPVS